MKSRLHALLFRTDLEATRFLLALGAILIGLGFMWPVDTFPTAAQLAAGTGRHTYAIMAQLMPEWAWGVAFFTQGSVMMYSLLTQRYSCKLLWLDAFFGMVLWTVSISSCYLAYWAGWANVSTYRPPAIMGGEVAAALASWWVFVRYNCSGGSRNRRSSDRG